MAAREDKRKNIAVGHAHVLATFNNINAVGSRFVPLLTSLQKYYAAKKKRQAEEATRPSETKDMIEVCCLEAIGPYSQAQ